LPGMDAYDHLDLDEIDFAPVEPTAKRLDLLALEEAHGLLRLLVAVAQDGGPMSREADRLAREIAARIPSEADRIAQMDRIYEAAPESRVRP
jgi:hypothetical protein